MMLQIMIMNDAIWTCTWYIDQGYVDTLSDLMLLFFPSPTHPKTIAENTKDGIITILKGRLEPKLLTIQ